MKTTLKFSDQLLKEVQDKMRNSEAGDVVVNADEQDSKKYLSSSIIKHWLNFAVYYEKAAAVFIGEWLKTTTEDDAFVHFAHQVEDEANHYRWLKNHLRQYSNSVDRFIPPQEWRFLMQDYYPKLPTLIERLAAHNIAAETGALGFSEFYFDRMPEEIKTTLEKVIKDERYHVSFGKRLLDKYCNTESKRKLARETAYSSMKYMFNARSVFVQI